MNPAGDSGLRATGTTMPVHIAEQWLMPFLDHLFFGQEFRQRAGEPGQRHADEGIALQPAALQPELPEGAQSRNVVVERAPAVAPLALDHKVADLPGFQPVEPAVGEAAAVQPAPEILKSLPVVPNGVARIAALLGQVIEERREP